MREESCKPKDIELKSLFLGPQAENSEWTEEMMLRILRRWFGWRKSLYLRDGSAVSKKDQAHPHFRARQKKFREATESLAKRFEGEIPKFSPRYIGHMFSEISLPALFGHFIALLQNPNNISEESSQVGIQIESEAIGALAKMIGYPRSAHGHFTSGGTLANFEAIVRARTKLGARSRKRASILVPKNSHYSWSKGASLIGLEAQDLIPIDLDERGRLSPSSLEHELLRHQLLNKPVFMVVSVAGSTEFGVFDPVHQIQSVINKYRKKNGLRIWHHVDAAYGGFFCSLKSSSGSLSQESRRALRALARADSVTLDPHKLGYVPYSCGAILVRTRKNYELPSFDAPYVRLKKRRAPGLHSLEGSRPATGAAATWMIHQTTGFNSDGYGRILNKTLESRQKLEAKLRSVDPRIRILPRAESNILCFHVSETGMSLRESNAWTERLYEKFSHSGSGEFFASSTLLDQERYSEMFRLFSRGWRAKTDQKEIVLIRVCLMNPFFSSKETATDYTEAFARAVKRHLAK